MKGIPHAAVAYRMLIAVLLASPPLCRPHAPTRAARHPSMRLANTAETARRVAAMRAVETLEGSGAFADPLAELFAGAEQLELARRFRAKQVNPPANMIDAVSLRCLAVDSVIIDACGAARQVVCLGAGMDSRPYRLALPLVDWFEIDVAEICELKESLLANAPPELPARVTVRRLERIALDLGAELELLEDALASRGWDSTAATLFVIEGVCYYLSEPELRSLLRVLPCASGTRAVTTSITQAMIDAHTDADNVARFPYVAPLGALWRSSERDLRRVALELGWRVEAERALRSDEAPARSLVVKPPAELVLPAGADEIVFELAPSGDAAPAPRAGEMTLADNAIFVDYIGAFIVFFYAVAAVLQTAVPVISR